MIFAKALKVVDKASDSSPSIDHNLIELQEKELAEKTYRLSILLRAIVKLGYKSFSEYDESCIENIKGHPIYKIILPVELNVEIDKCIDLIQTSGNVSKALLAYREQMMKGFSKESRQKDGKVYTGDKTIIEWIHDKLEKYNPIDLNKNYWEPSCGTGSFVIDWYERLMNHWIKNKEKYPDITNEEEVHKWIIEKCIYYSDIDPFAIRLCTLQLFLKNPRVKGIKYNSYRGDSLLDEPFKQIEKFDYVAGNPPYVSFQKGKLDKSYRGLLEKKYSVYHHRGDILTLFLQEGCLRGIVSGFVTSRYWMESESLTGIHDFLKPHIREIWDHGNDDGLFGDTMVRTACFVSTIEESTTVVIEGVGEQTKEKLQSLRWTLGEEKVSFKNSVPLSHYCMVKDGIYTGANKVFVLSIEEARKKGFTISPVITGDLVRKYTTLPSVESFVNETTDIASPEYLYLEANREVLEKRTTGKPFYKYMGGGFEKWGEGILARCYTDSNHYGFSFRKEGEYGLNSNVYLVSIKNVLQSKQVLAILNSKVMQYRFLTKIKRRANNFMLTTGDYKLLPMPSTPDSRLDPLVDKMLSDPNDKVTEAEINKIVYELYNLTPDEIKTIEETVK